MPHLTTMIGAVSVATSCFASVNSETGLIVGVIHTGVPLATIEAPDTVRWGAAFGAVVNTFKSSSCSSPEGVKLTLRPAEARVTPYDRVPAETDDACTSDTSANAHPFTLRFRQLGVATIVAVGMVIDETSGQRKHGEVTKTVVVVP